MLRRVIARAAILKQPHAAASVRAYGNLYEPDYLESLKPKYPLYNTFNIRINGYDYPILESYQRLVHTIAEALELDVVDSWAASAVHHQVQRYKPASNVIDSEYKLAKYERVVQITDVQAPVYPIFVRLLQAGLPEGVSLKIAEHSDEEEEIRYVPDKDLLDLKQQLDDLGGPTQTKKK